MAIIAIVGREGGIGKSTIAGNLVAEVTEMGSRVVAFDADPQHGLCGLGDAGRMAFTRASSTKSGAADVRPLYKSADSRAERVMPI